MQQRQFNAMLKRTPSRDEGEVDESESEPLQINSDDDDEEYLDVPERDAFEAILQGIDNGRSNPPVSRITTPHPQQQFAMDEARQLAQEVYDRNIGSQYATNETMVTDYVERFLGSDAATDKEIEIFQNTKKKMDEDEHHRGLHWTCCYEDYCMQHYDEKSGAGWFPKTPRNNNADRDEYDKECAHDDWRICQDWNCGEHVKEGVEAVKKVVPHKLLEWTLCDNEPCEDHDSKKGTMPQDILGKKWLRVKASAKKSKNGQTHQ